MKRFFIFIVALISLSRLSGQESVNTVVNTLKERILLSGYAQAGYTYDDEKDPDNMFDVKRIIFMAEGRITRDWLCYFMYNFNAGGSLTEVYTEYKFLPGLSARLGQFKTPYTIENLISPSSLELINCYSQATNYLAGIDNSDKLYGGMGGRDMGLMIYGRVFDELVDYQLAVMNGQGINVKDQNNSKDIAGSVMLNLLKELSVGGSFNKGKGCALDVSAVNSAIKPGESYTRNRWSAGAVIETKNVSVRSEYLNGKDGKIRSDGFYALASFHVLPKKLDVIASYDYFNRDKTFKDKQTNYIAGLQYWFYPRCRVQAQYTFRDKKNGGNSNLIQTQIQVRF